MIGRNELKLCAAEMLVALQEYLDKRWGAYSSKAIDVQYHNHMYTITLEGESGTVPVSPPLMPVYPDPCPWCVPGTMCSHVNCGRYAISNKGGVRNAQRKG